ncbi:MAG: NAD-dependent epimerase/dehydratase family protein [Bacteriovoracaceae bacterium]
MKSQLKILITGATGFVGSHLVDRLLEDGHLVYVLVRTPAKLKLLNNQFHENIRTLRGSLGPKSELSWTKDLPEDLDAVFHIAGIVHSFSWKDFYSVNYRSTHNLLERLKEKYQSLNFILLSSMAASGPNKDEGLLDSKTQEDPVSHYGKSKLMAEHCLRDSIPADWQYQIIRPPAVFGPRDPAILDFFKMVKNQVVLIPGLKGHQKTYSFVCVFDLIEILCQSLYQIDKKPNQTFYSSHPKSVTLEEIIDQIQKSLNKRRVHFITIPDVLLKLLAWLSFFINRLSPIDARLTPDKVRELLPPRWECDGSEVSEPFSISYKWDLEKTVDITKKDYKDRSWI